MITYYELISFDSEAAQVHWILYALQWLHRFNQMEEEIPLQTNIFIGDIKKNKSKTQSGNNISTATATLVNIIHRNTSFHVEIWLLQASNSPNESEKVKISMIKYDGINIE